MRSSSANPPPKRLKPSLPPSAASLLLFLVACFIYFASRAPFIGQWDSFDYLKQTVTHRLSDLAFGRPVFLGYNIVLWETSRWLFGLVPLQVESVVIVGIVLTGAAGVLLFRRLARHLLPAPLWSMATLAFLLSPMYAIYAGSVMTEVPMLVAILAAGLVLWESGRKHPALGAMAGGLWFGLAVGIREQAATLGAACLWILWERRPDLPSRLRAWFQFALSAGVVTLTPIVFLYFRDQAGFHVRMKTWLHAIPMGGIHLLKNVEATLLFTLAVCPGAWLALLGGGILYACGRMLGRSRPARTAASILPASNVTRSCGMRVSHPGWGVICTFILPMAVLWRDADVQMHPRYLLILLPAALLLSVWLYSRLLPSGNAAIGWAVVQVVVFGISAIALEPIRQVQYEKRQFADLVRQAVPDQALLIAGGLSPTLDYYRGLEIRPKWRILWSGWGWNQNGAADTIRKAWDLHEPVYLCEAPYGWLMFEDERLDLYFVLKDCPRETIAPGITRYYPPRGSSFAPLNASQPSPAAK